MDYAVKAATSGKYRKKNTIILVIASLLAIVGIVMMIYSIIKASWLFVISYFIALILIFTYIMVRINTVYVTYLAADKELLTMKTWGNNFLPYDVGNKIKILSEFVPAKTKLIEIPIEEISKIMIGTKNFIKRNAADDEKFADDIAPYEISKDYYKKRTMSSMDIFYVRLIDDDSYYMPIMNFNTKSVKKLMSLLLSVKPEIEVAIGSRAYRTFKRTPKTEQ